MTEKVVLLRGRQGGPITEIQMPDNLLLKPLQPQTSRARINRSFRLLRNGEFMVRYEMIERPLSGLMRFTDKLKIRKEGD